MPFFSNLLSTIRKYNVEPVLFLYGVGRNLYMPTTYTQFITDKVCLFNYNLNSEFCRNINNDTFKDTIEADSISSDVANLVLFGQLILSIPSILAAIFLGPWLDMHTIAPKIVLLLCVASGLFEVSVLLVNNLFFDAPVFFVLMAHILNGITGGNMLLMTAAFTIAMKETRLQERTFRFTILEFALLLPNPTANYISSLILPCDSWFLKDELRNYFPIFVLSAACALVCLLYITFLIGDVKEVFDADDNIIKRASIRTSLQPLSTEYLVIKNRKDVKFQYSNHAFENEDQKERKSKIVTISESLSDDMNNNYLEKEQTKNKVSSLSPDDNKNATRGEMFHSLFQKKNATLMIQGIFKRREENAHILLWLTIIIYVTSLICINGAPLIMTLFVQKAYSMPPNIFMKIDSIGHLAYGLVTTVFLVILHKIKFDDTKTIIIGLVSLFLFLFSRGAVLKVEALYASYAFGFVFLISVVACRGFVSKIIPENEIGTIMGALSVFYSMTPMIGSLLYTQVFKLTLHFNAGFVYLVASALTFITICLAIYLNIKYKKYKIRMDAKKNLQAG